MPRVKRIYSNVIPSNRVARVVYGHSVNPLAVPRGATVVLERSKGAVTATTTTTTTQPGTTTTSTTTTTTAQTAAARGAQRHRR